MKKGSNKIVQKPMVFSVGNIKKQMKTTRSVTIRERTGAELRPRFQKQGTVKGTNARILQKEGEEIKFVKKTLRVKQSIIAS